MKKKLTLLLFCLSFANMAYTQSFPKVNLFFYLDATQSMEKNGLWEKSKKNLIDAIVSIEDERTEVTVCAFADFIDKNHKEALNSYSRFDIERATANDEGKKKLISFVHSLPSPTESVPSRSEYTLTNLARPWNHFVNESKKKTGDDWINAMILITDGGHEEEYFKDDLFFNHVRNWHAETASNCFGWVVELKDKVSKKEEGPRKKMNDYIDAQKSLGRLKWVKEKNSFNFKFLTIKSIENSLNLNNTTSFNVKVAGNTKSALAFAKNINLSLSNNDRMTLETELYNDTTIQVKFCNCDLIKEPEQQTLFIAGSIPEEVEKENLVSLIRSADTIICLNSFSRTLNIYQKKENGKQVEIKQYPQKTLGTIEYYRPCRWLGSKDKQKPAQITLNITLNEDAINNHASAMLSFTDKEGNPLDNKHILISENDNPIHSMTVSQAEEERVLSIAFNPEIYDEKVIVGGIKLVNNKDIDNVNGIDVQGREESKPFLWQIKINYHINPLLKLLICLLIILICLLLLGLYVIWHHRTFSLRFPTEGRAIFAPIGNAQNIQILGCNYKGQQIVALGGSDTILTELLNPFYIKEIVVINPNSINPYIPQTRGWWDRLWNGDSIYINGDFFDYPISNIVFRPCGIITKEDIMVVVNFNMQNCQQTITLPISSITQQNLQTLPIGINNTETTLYGSQPLNAVNRSFVQRIINKSINILTN